MEYPYNILIPAYPQTLRTLRKLLLLTLNQKTLPKTLIIFHYHLCQVIFFSPQSWPSMVSRTTITSKPQLKGTEASCCLNFLDWKVWIRGLNQRTITNPKNLKEQRFGWHLITNLVGFGNIFCDIWSRATGWITLVKGTWKTSIIGV